MRASRDNWPRRPEQRPRLTFVEEGSCEQRGRTLIRHSCLKVFISFHRNISPGLAVTPVLKVLLMSHGLSSCTAYSGNAIAASPSPPTSPSTSLLLLGLL